MKKKQSSINLIKQKEQKIKKNLNLLNKIMSSDVSYLNLKKVSFKRESGCVGHKDKDTKCFSLIAYAKKGPISLDENKVIIPEANYYEYEEILNNEKDTRGGNLIDSFPYTLQKVLLGEHKQTRDWHLFYYIGGFSGPGGIGATNVHSSLYVFSGYDRFKKLEKICKKLNLEEFNPDNLRVYPKMPWPSVKELHFLAGLSGPLPLPEINKMRNLMNITERDEAYSI